MLKEGDFNSLKEEVLKRVEKDGRLPAYSFFNIMKEELEGTVRLPIIIPVHHLENVPPNRTLVSGYCGTPDDSPDFLEGKGPLTLIISDWNTTEASLTQKHLDDLASRPVEFFHKVINENDFLPTIENTNAVVDLVLTIQEAMANDSISELRVIVFTSRTKGKNVHKANLSEIDGLPVVVDVWDLKRWTQWRSSDQEREPIDIILEESEYISALRVDQGSEDSVVYLAAVPGLLLARLYEDWHNQLLEQNVRLFLQNRTNVNKGIRRTITEEPERFLLFNNGITATADEVVFVNSESNASVGRIEAFSNFQIVNGGQTTASIYSAFSDLKLRENIESVFVQMKLTVVSPEKTTELVPLISRYANSQNKIQNADFFSNHKFHIWFEQCSRRILPLVASEGFLPRKWFYERTRGQYDSEKTRLKGRVARREFESEFPKDQKFTKTDLAKYYVSWTDEGYKVNLGAEKNFLFFADLISKEWDENPEIFDDDFYRELIAKKLIFDAVRDVVGHATWYETGGYLAQHVPLTIGLINAAAQRVGKKINFMNIWERQEVPEDFRKFILTCGEIAHHILLNPEKGYRNVTEWAKKEQCWGKISENLPRIPSNFERFLI
ncbi:hypothetical protein BSR28_01785 [Boudabousia liubingyangii]|uniref:AIPR family protein n=1 Tax=Boudabousia liubingyangii TaxID=1921764 RepID=UPI00093EDF53|nr:AIPR family protein [Boudabousia liubingyangii]OKL48456.1 hypothetical protein BSR28_01785 [Boudabousia liubingyangii]